MTRTISAMRAGAAGLAVALSLTVAGCSGDRPTMPAGQNFSPNQATRFSLVKGDLPSEFKRVESGTRTEPCDSGWLANQGALTETASEAAIKVQLLALSPQRCHLSEYEKIMRDPETDGIGVTGYLVFAAVFPDSDAASRALPLLRQSVSDPLYRESFSEAGEDVNPAEDVAATGLGDESVAGLKRAFGPPGVQIIDPSDSYVYIWRVRNVAVRLYGGADLTEREVLQIAKNISDRVVR